MIMNKIHAFNSETILALPFGHPVSEVLILGWSYFLAGGLMAVSTAHACTVEPRNWGHPRD